jgi:4-hydroxybenzoyl-CoA thioesterase
MTAMFSNTSWRMVVWGDCDPAGIIFYPRFFDVFDAATAELMKAATGLARFELIAREAVVGWPMVDTRAVFHAPVRFDDHVRIETRVTRLGRSSFDVEHTLWLDEVLCVTGYETRVWAARGEGRQALSPRPIPEPIRARLASPREG